MANPLYDTLFGVHAGKSTPFSIEPDRTVIAYSDFLGMAAQYAHAMTELGVRPDDRVAAQIEKSPEALALYAACVHAGVMFLPLNTGYTAAELSYFVHNSGASLMVADASKAQDIGPIAARLGLRLTTLNADGSGALADLARSPTDMFETVDRRGSDPAALLYTSGTTGRSKGAMPSQDNLLSNTIAFCKYWQFTDRDLLLHALPIFHTHGLFVATHITLNAGGSTILPFCPNSTSMP